MAGATATIAATASATAMNGPGRTGQGRTARGRIAPGTNDQGTNAPARSARGTTVRGATDLRVAAGTGGGTVTSAPSAPGRTGPGATPSRSSNRAAASSPRRPTARPPPPCAARMAPSPRLLTSCVPAGPGLNPRARRRGRPAAAGPPGPSRATTCRAARTDPQRGCARSSSGLAMAHGARLWT